MLFLYPGRVSVSSIWLTCPLLMLTSCSLNDSFVHIQSMLKSDKLLHFFYFVLTVFIQQNVGLCSEFQTVSKHEIYSLCLRHKFTSSWHLNLHLCQLSGFIIVAAIILHVLLVYFLRSFLLWLATFLFHEISLITLFHPLPQTLRLVSIQFLCQLSEYFLFELYFKSKNFAFHHNIVKLYFK